MQSLEIANHQTDAIVYFCCIAALRFVLKLCFLISIALFCLFASLLAVVNSYLIDLLQLAIHIPKEALIGHFNLPFFKKCQKIASF